MQKLTITRVFKATKKKDGTPYPYPRCSIQAVEYGDQWISGKWNDTSDRWKEGDVVEVDVHRKGDFLNFYLLESTSTNRSDELEARVKRLETQLAGFNRELEAKFAQLKIDLTLEMTGKFQTEKDYKKNNSEMDELVESMRKPEESEAINPDDIPF